MKKIIKLIQLEKDYKREQLRLQQIFEEEKNKLINQYEGQIQQLEQELSQKDTIIAEEVKKHLTQLSKIPSSSPSLLLDTAKAKDIILSAIN